MRLDQMLVGKEGVKSRSAAQRLIDAKRVRVNGRVATKASLDVSVTDHVEWDVFPSSFVPSDTPSSFRISVLYEDDSCMVISKPAGLVVHPGHGTKGNQETLLDALRPLFDERALPYSSSDILVHRLDKDTTGCLLVAKSAEAHLFLQKQFAARTVDKRYLALVAGKPVPPSAVIDAPIGRHMNERTRMSVHQAVASRSARTTYRTLSSDSAVTLLECELHTGRTHQIRVHLKTIGHPVLGDTTYASGAAAVAAERLGIHFLCLHAWKLTFHSPTSGLISVVCPLPETFASLLTKLSFDVPTV